MSKKTIKNTQPTKTQPKTKITKKKNTKLPINYLDPLMKFSISEMDVHARDENGKEIPFKIKTYLAPDELLQFVRDVTSICVVDGVYYPALFDFAFKLTFFEIATNITLPSNIEKAANFIYGTGVYEIIVGETKHFCCHVEPLVSRLEKACREQIDLITRKSKSDELFDLIISIVEKYESKLDGINIKELANKLTGIGSIDEKKLADAVLGRSSGEIIDFPVLDNEQLEGQVGFDSEE